jgi:hypothetical protein
MVEGRDPWSRADNLSVKTTVVSEQAIGLTTMVNSVVSWPMEDIWLDK